MPNSIFSTLDYAPRVADELERRFGAVDHSAQLEDAVYGSEERGTYYCISLVSTIERYLNRCLGPENLHHLLTCLYIFGIVRVNPKIFTDDASANLHQDILRWKRKELISQYPFGKRPHQVLEGMFFIFLNVSHIIDRLLSEMDDLQSQGSMGAIWPTCLDRLDERSNARSV